MLKATSAYVDDIYVNEDVLSADEVESRLESFGLASKDPTRLRDGAVVLGLKVCGGAQDIAVEARECNSGTPRYTDATHSFFPSVGSWLGHFPVCRWLCQLQE